MAARALVYVHGAGKQSRPRALKSEIDRILFGRDASFTRLGYYADVRWPPAAGTGPGARASAKARRERAVRRAASPDLSAEAAADEVVRAALAQRPSGRSGASGTGAVPPRDRQAAEEIAAELFRNADRVARRSSARKRRPGAGPFLPDPIFRMVVGFFASDVIDYLYGGYAERMRAAVREALLKKPAPDVIVAHSLGTIVTYDVLSEPGLKSLKANLVTVGSPLGIGNVQARLRDRAGRPNPVPKGLMAWANFADRFDPVALDASLRDAFEPPEDFADDEVVNNAARNNHDLTGYLAVELVGSYIRQAVGQP
jgi:hypothetical protein